MWDLGEPNWAKVSGTVPGKGNGIRMERHLHTAGVSGNSCVRSTHCIIMYRPKYFPHLGSGGGSLFGVEAKSILCEVVGVVKWDHGAFSVKSVCTDTASFLCAWNGWKVNDFAEQPCQSCSRKAEQTSHLVTEAKPSPFSSPEVDRYSACESHYKTRGKIPLQTLGLVVGTTWSGTVGFFNSNIHTTPPKTCYS